MGDGGSNVLSLPRVLILLTAIASAALVVTIYHCIIVSLSNRRRSPTGPQPRRQEETPSELDNSMVQLIPAFKYDKEVGLTGNDGTCSVCLCDFEEGEELRSMPECTHSFHAPCIDMWLYSHTSCPLCRADITPSPSPMRFQSQYDVSLPLQEFNRVA